MNKQLAKPITVALLLALGLGLSVGASAQSSFWWGDKPQLGRSIPPSPSAPAGSGDMSGGDHKMDMGAMQGGSAPPDARDPDYSDGQDFSPYPLTMMDSHSFGSLLIDELESVRSEDNKSSAYDLQAWYGRTYDRAVFKGEGEVDGGELTEARSELLWGHAVATYWDTQLGVRYDHGNGPNRSWLAFGVQGLAPYWFDLELTGYVGEEGRAALRLDSEYEILFTQRLILTPRVETNVYSKSDNQRDLGSGLSDVVAGLRLRYEIRRQFAPYVGVEWSGKFGETQDLVKAAGESAYDTRLVAGLRLWF